METRRRKSNENSTAVKTGEQRTSYGYQGRATLSTEDALKALEVSSDVEESAGETSSSEGVTMDTKQSDVTMETGVISPASGSKPRETVESEAKHGHEVRRVVSGDPNMQSPLLRNKGGRKRRGKENREVVALRSSRSPRTSRLEMKTKPRTEKSTQAKNSSSEVAEYDCEDVVSSDESAVEADMGGTAVPESKSKKKVLSGYKAKKEVFSKRKKAALSSRVEGMLSPGPRRKNWRVCKRLSNRGVLLRLPTADQKLEVLSSEEVLVEKGRTSKERTRREMGPKLDKENVSTLDDSMDEGKVNVWASTETTTSHGSSFPSSHDTIKSANEECSLAHDSEDKSHDSECVSHDQECLSHDNECASPDEGQQSSRVSCNGTWSVFQ